MADIIDLALVAESRRFLSKLLDTRGLAYFLRANPSRPYQLEPEKVDLVVRAAAKSREGLTRPHAQAYEYARKQVRRELIRRVVAEMIHVGL
jgi:hypothetical protein